MVKCFLMFMELAEKSAKLHMNLALVFEFFEFPTRSTREPWK